MASHEWELTGVPYTSMKEPGGIAHAIDVLRAEGLAEELRGLGVSDAGDLSVESPTGVRGGSRLLNESALVTLVEATRRRVAEAGKAGRLPLLVGGDCPVVLGALAAMRDLGRSPGLVMLDGHEDAWPPERSVTGEASDSEVAIALGRVTDLPPALAAVVPLLELSALAMLGPRDAREIREAGVATLREELAFFVAGDEVASGSGATAQMAAALERLTAEAFWLHVDLDVLSSDAFPAVDYPQPGGLDWDTLALLVASATGDPRCRGASVVIYNPDLDPGRRSARSLVSFLQRLVVADRSRCR
jgi:arginase